MAQLSIFPTAKSCVAIVLLTTFLSGCAETAPTDSDATTNVAADASDDSVAVHVPQPDQSTEANSAAGSMSGMKMMAVPENIVFKDEVATNVTMPQGLDGLLFIDTDGKRVQISDYVGKKRVILVFTEGFAGMLCPFCKTQTARLVANYDKFKALDTEILVVYPGERDHVEEFIEAARNTDKGQVDRVPFPIVLDPKMEAVDYFNIRSKLAHPSTYLIDKNGKVQFAYVGDDMTADRPSIKALLRTIKAAAVQETNGE